MDDRIKQNGAICDRCNDTLTTYAITHKSRCEFDCTPEDAAQFWLALPLEYSVSDAMPALMNHLAERARFVPMGFEYACAGCLTEWERVRFDLEVSA